MSTRPRTVLYVHHGSGQGGAAVSLANLLRHLDPDRYIPIVAVDYGRERARGYFSGKGFRTEHLTPAPFRHTSKTWRWETPGGAARLVRWRVLLWPKAKRGFASLLARCRPDIVHLNGLSVLPLARIAAAAGTPVVQHVREPVHPGVFGVRKRWLERTASRYVDEMIYICADNAERMRRVTTPGTVVYNPVDVARFEQVSRNAARAALGIPERAEVILFPGGSVFDVKGFGPFVQAVAALHAAGRPVLALVPGVDPTSMAAIRASGQTDAFLTPPFADDVERYYAAAEIVAAPFIAPHFSRAVIEAGAARRPVVASRIGGITEVVDDGVTGLLTPPGDSDALAETMVRLLDDPPLAARMGEAGNERARREFDSRKQGEKVMTIYDRVLQ